MRWKRHRERGTGRDAQEEYPWVRLVGDDLKQLLEIFVDGRGRL